MIRRYIDDKKIPLSPEAASEAKKRRKSSVDAKAEGNLSIGIRQNEDDVAYLSMGYLAYLVDNKKGVIGPCLARDADEYKPLRDALMHTSQLTDAAKIKLSAVYENIKGRLRTLLASP